MCGLCGMFGVGGHWTDGPAQGGMRPAERQHRTRVLNWMLGLYGLRAAEWHGRLVVSGPTGRQQVVEDLGAMWVAAEALAGKPLDPLDPLDPRVLERIGAG